MCIRDRVQPRQTQRVITDVVLVVGLLGGFQRAAVLGEVPGLVAGVDIDEFANEMFEAGEKLDGKTAEEVFLQDFKVFMCRCV